MSRFKPRGGTEVVAYPSVKTGAFKTAHLETIPAEQPVIPATPAKVEEAEERSSLFQTVGLFVLFAYMLSGVLNDVAMRVAGTKTYISVLTLVLLPLVLVVSGGIFRGMRHYVGWLWLAFFAWMMLATPFSTYRRGSVEMLMSYGPRSFLIYFYITAFALTMKSITRLMYVVITANAILVLSCWTSGAMSEDGRFRIVDSAFWSNSNDVALALLIAAVQFLYLLFSKAMLPKVIALVGVFGCLFYMSRTGSRGAMLALFAVVLGMFYTTKRKALFLGLAIPCVLAFFLFASSASLHRLLTLTTGASQAEDLGAVGSETQRKHLFIRSLQITLQHPLFGVGPDEFAAYEFGEVTAKGGWTSWVGTHNSYTEVSSECGVPAFLCYSGVIFVCLSLSYRMYKQSRDKPVLKEINRISFVLVAGLMVYAIATLFFHMAYTGLLPSLAGTTMALYFASKKTFESQGVKLYAK